jgi:hypothetical protein
MSDYIRSSTLEHFPNELLLELFECFMDIRDIYNGFRGLNRRFDFLVRSCKNLHVTLTYDMNDLMMSFFASRIIRFVVNQFKHKDLTRFQNLHSLTVYGLSSYQFKQIRPDIFPYLVYLRLQRDSQVLILKPLCELIFSNGFPHLCKAVLKCIRCLLFWPKVGNSPSIRSLSIISSDHRIYEYPLVLCPNLVHLHLFLIPKNNHAPDFILAQNPRLKHLSIAVNVYNWPLHVLATMLSHVPNLERLNLIIKLKPCVFDLSALARVLDVHVSHLHHFKCYLRYHHKVIDLHRVRQYHLCFERMQMSYNRKQDAYFVFIK